MTRQARAYISIYYYLAQPNCNQSGAKSQLN